MSSIATSEEQLIRQMHVLCIDVPKNLDDSIDKSKVIIGPDSNRKKHNNHKIKMDENGCCPIDGCDYINKNGNLSTAQMHIQLKHSVLAGYRTHTYMCPHCDKTFRGRSPLNHHLANKHNPHKFGCPHCPYTAAQKVSVATHIMTKHQNWTSSNCVDVNNQCVNCAKQLSKTGHLAHIAGCLGFTTTVRNI